MRKDKIYRQIDVFDKKTEELVDEIVLDFFDLDLMKSRFEIPPDDHLMYNPYEIDSSKTDLFSTIKFNFKKYDYFIACYRGLSKDEQEVWLINNYCKKALRKRLINQIKSHRDKFRKSLSHFDSLDLSLFDNLIINEKEIIRKQAEKLKTKQVYVISESSDFDRKIFNLNECLDSVLFSGFGNIIIFGESKFVYFEGEGKNNRWISK
ncbi:hypothetical protein SAMN05444285_1672 [Draconibacterium orientale]|uniref:DUF7683 domain-containing protein n=1 Tax=Draconibacterium orientale TaxID=1168034 RepID=X5DLW0_9BACT|nr:hypothetical protein [Draconibacterium orientale]AHW61562.1 hypothetical protein FH5T_03760 [Draconibacterium orientale]SEU16320.1 hypothetical protein SAMN05444285_1672 [Draconibacterium orientale]